MKKLYYSLLAIALFLPVASVRAVELVNPLGAGNDDVRVIIGNVIRAALSLSGSIALLMFVYGGFLWLTSGGNQTQIDKGKKVLVWSTLGVVLIASAFVIVTALFQGLTTGDVSGTP